MVAMGEKWDVIVAGAGTAGLAAARVAAAEGGKVLLLEMQAQIGGHAHSVDLVPHNFSPLGKELAVIDLDEVWLHSLHGDLGVKYDKGDVIDRSHFDRLLAIKVAESGADIWLNAPVKGLLIEGGAVCGVHIEAGGWSENIKGEVVIDATGSRGGFSSLFLREVLKERWKSELLAFSNEYLMANASGDRSADIFFDSYSAPGGHAWVYPLAKGFAVSGVQGLRIHPDAALDEFLGRRAITRLSRSLPIASSRGQLPLEGPLFQTCAEGIVAVGGAAGQIYPPSGQGLRYAYRCGEIAGRVAVDAVTDGDVSKERLFEYEKSWRQEFEWEFEIGRQIHSSLSVSQDRKMDAIISALNEKPRLQRAFFDVFNGFELNSSVKILLNSEEIAKILGRETVGKLE